MSSSSSQDQKTCSFYVKSGLSGAIAANLTHVVLVPLDVCKTKMQINKEMYPSLKTTIQKLLVQPSSLSLGFGATSYGYASQGFLKYGLYEVFKSKFAQTIGTANAEKYSSILYMTAGMTAESIADIALTPFEAARIRLVSNPTFASGTFSAISKIGLNEGFGFNGLYKGFIPLILKQVPYTAVKFAVFEAVSDTLYSWYSNDSISKSTQLSITFASGLVGGVASAIASHPADSLLTTINAQSRKPGISMTSTICTCIKNMGWSGIWAGLFPRMGMVGIMAASQLLVYDAAKVLIFSLPVSQGVKKRKNNKH